MCVLCRKRERDLLFVNFCMCFLYCNLSESYLSLDFLVLYQALTFSSILLGCMSLASVALAPCIMSWMLSLLLFFSCGQVYPGLLLLWLLVWPVCVLFKVTSVPGLPPSAFLSLPMPLCSQVVLVLIHMILRKLLLPIEISLFKSILLCPISV